jgi:hypothetical protein
MPVATKPSAKNHCDADRVSASKLSTVPVDRELARIAVKKQVSATKPNTNCSSIVVVYVQQQQGSSSGVS